MKIVSWNCHYGFTPEKVKAINSYEADILVIPECRKKDMEGSGYDKDRRDWYGDHKEAENLSENIRADRDLGIGVFWKEGIIITRLPEWDNTLSKESDFRYLVPYKVEGNFEPFTLIAVWTKNKTDASDPLDYVQKAHAAVDHYNNIGLLNGRVVLIGDFNSNVIWDDRYGEKWNHSALVKKLEGMGINEILSPLEKDKYHTFFYYRKKEFWVIDDYCFTSADLAKSAKLSVPGSDEWAIENGAKRWNGSDHCPIIVDFDF